jgi:hypothetical protein
LFVPPLDDAHKAESAASADSRTGPSKRSRERAPSQAARVLEEGGARGDPAVELLYRLDGHGYARLKRHLENQKILIAMLTTLVISQYFMYMRVTRSLIEVFAMTTINGAQYLTRSLADEAFTRIHYVAMTFSVVWVIGFTVGMPAVGFGVLIWMNRTGRQNDPRWRTAFGFLSDGYKTKYYWWEGVVLLRKLVLLLLAIVWGNDSFLQAFAAVFVLSFAMLLQAQFQPYESLAINVLDLAAMAAVYLTRLAAILFHHLNPKERALKEECEHAFQTDCRPNRVAIAKGIAAVVIGVHALLILAFAFALANQRAVEMNLYRRLWTWFKACLAGKLAARRAARDTARDGSEGDTVAGDTVGINPLSGDAGAGALDNIDFGDADDSQFFGGGAAPAPGAINPLAAKPRGAVDAVDFGGDAPPASFASVAASNVNPLQDRSGAIDAVLDLDGGEEEEKRRKAGKKKSLTFIEDDGRDTAIRASIVGRGEGRTIEALDMTREGELLEPVDEHETDEEY